MCVWWLARVGGCSWEDVGGKPSQIPFVSFHSFWILAGFKFRTEGGSLIILRWDNYSSYSAVYLQPVIEYIFWPIF